VAAFAEDQMMMKPPWVIYPKISAGSIGWRMGPGETYWDEFDRWYKNLPEDTRLRFRSDNPEPEGWDDFYDLKEKHLTSWTDAERAK
jgi:hypothetical protein